MLARMGGDPRVGDSGAGVPPAGGGFTGPLPPAPPARDVEQERADEEKRRAADAETARLEEEKARVEAAEREREATEKRERELAAETIVIRYSAKFSRQS